MALTSLDPVTALIVIDLQKGILARAPAHLVAPVIAHAAQLTAAFRRHRLPVVLVTVAGGAPGRNEQPRPAGDVPADYAELVADIGLAPDDHRIVKRSWGAFTGTDLDAWLKAHSVTQVVVIGVATAIGVESTARQAHELGYNVTLAIDAMADLSIETHNNSIQRIFPRLGETGTTGQVIALLDAVAPPVQA